MDRLISIGELAEMKAVSVDTIRRWEQQRTIKSVRTDGGHRRYRLADFVEQKPGKTIAYARVSSHDQKADLDRQDAVLSGYCQSQAWDYEVISLRCTGNHHCVLSPTLRFAFEQEQKAASKSCRIS